MIHDKINLLRLFIIKIISNLSPLVQVYPINFSGMPLKLIG